MTPRHSILFFDQYRGSVHTHENEQQLDTCCPPLSSACRSGSGRPLWISHSLQSAQPGLFMSVKIAWPLLRFKGKLCVVFLLPFSEMLSYVPCQISSSLSDVINRSAPSELNRFSAFFLKKSFAEAEPRQWVGVRVSNTCYTAESNWKWNKIIQISLYFLAFTSWIEPEGEVIK